MKRFKKLVIVFCFIVLNTSFLACNNQTTERTTLPMTSDNSSETTTTETTSSTTSNTTTTETTTTETTTTENINVSFSEVRMVNDQAIQNELLEFDLIEDLENGSLSTQYNPYDYEEIKVVFEFTTPANKTIRQTAFWYRGYETINLIGEERNEEGFYTAGQEYIDWGDDSTSRYRVRINPNEVGTWDYQMQLIINGLVVQTLNNSFTVMSGEESLGYIMIDQTNKRNFIYSNEDKTYIPMGANFAWFRSTLGTYDYHNWFKYLNQENGNFARIWLSNWSLSIHKFSYTNFDSRQNILARIDMLMDFAKEYDVYIMLTLINHGQFSANTNPEWAENPYNKENGGMLDYPIQFFYNEEAKAHYKNELMYIISRYGYSEHIFAWELFNEVDWIDGYSGLVVTRWHDEMAQFIKENDPYKHLVSTSYKYTFGTPAFSYESLDFANFHSYAYGDSLYYDKLVGEMSSLWDQYQKPVFFGEIGIDWQSGSGTYSADYTGITIHQGLWGGMLSSAGGANQWWWDSWIEKYDLWDRFTGASTYALEIDVANKNYDLLQETEAVSVTGTNIKVIGYLLEDAIYGYLYNSRWNYWNREPSSVANVSVHIPLSNGEYTLYIYDTYSGLILEERTILVENEEFSLSDLTITTDYAFIVK